MPTLRIDLQDGFDGEPVTVRVGGRILFEGDDVRTNYALGRAATMETEALAGVVTVEVIVPRRAIAARHDVRLEADVYLAASIDGPGLSWRESAAPFAYY